MLIRFPRTIAAFIVGSSLAVSGCTFQSTFNNKLVSPDVLGVSSGACVGAAVSILLGVNSYFVGVFAFFTGLIAVSISLLLPKLFKSEKTVTLVLSGIIVSSLMNSIIGIIKFLADKDNKLGEITFWMMGSIAGITSKELATSFPIYIVSMVGVFLLRWKINIISLGEYEAKNLGLNYGLYRLATVLFATCLTAVSVSLSGNVGWVGLVVPHISRGLVGGDNRYAIPVSCLFGGTFMIIVDLISRNFSVNEIPLSIITGLIGTVIYTYVLIKKGRELND
jgi:iron complex transport system permease protein